MQVQDQGGSLGYGRPGSGHTNFPSVLGTERKTSQSSSHGASLEDLRQKTPGSGSRMWYSPAVPNTEQEVLELEIEIDLGLEASPDKSPSQNPSVSWKEGRTEEPLQILDSGAGIRKAAACDGGVQQENALEGKSHLAESVDGSHKQITAEQTSAATLGQIHTATRADFCSNSESHEKAQQQPDCGLQKSSAGPQNLIKPLQSIKPQAVIHQVASINLVQFPHQHLNTVLANKEESGAENGRLARLCLHPSQISLRQLHALSEHYVPSSGSQEQ